MDEFFDFNLSDISSGEGQQYIEGISGVLPMTSTSNVVSSMDVSESGEKLIIIVRKMRGERVMSIVDQMV